MPRDYKPLPAPQVDELAGYVTQSKAIELLNVNSAVWVHDLVRRGDIQAIRLDGRTLLFDKVSITNYLANRPRRGRYPHPSESEELAKINEQV